MKSKYVLATSLVLSLLLTLFVLILEVKGNQERERIVSELKVEIPNMIRQAASTKQVSLEVEYICGIRDAGDVNDSLEIGAIYSVLGFSEKDLTLNLLGSSQNGEEFTITYGTEIYNIELMSVCRLKDATARKKFEGILRIYRQCGSTSLADRLDRM